MEVVWNKIIIESDITINEAINLRESLVYEEKTKRIKKESNSMISRNSDKTII